MIHYNYSPQQLEEKAEELLSQFDEERLTRIKPIDVYAVIEKCLDVPYDWKYLTPDQSIWGMTAFRSGYTWVWPKSYYVEGMLPTKVFLEEGTIVIDSTLTEKRFRGPENFTVMYEVFHQVLHKRCFTRGNPDYTHVTTREAISGRWRPKTSLEICESQANACAVAFLMPRQLVTDTLHDRLGGTMKPKVSDPHYRGIILKMAEDFSVSPTAMKYRLLNLKLAEE